VGEDAPGEGAGAMEVGEGAGAAEAGEDAPEEGAGATKAGEGAGVRGGKGTEMVEKRAFGTGRP
jgi:hypothetical protein